MLTIHAERKGKTITLPDEEFSFLIQKVLEIQPLEVLERDGSSTVEEPAMESKPLRRHAYSLEELLEGAVEKEEELDWGQAAGEEVW